MTTQRKMAFKMGALKRMSELGITPTEFFQKAADLSAALSAAAIPASAGISAAGSVLGSGVEGLKSLGSKGLGLAQDAVVGLPVAGGAAAGALEAMADAPSSTDLKTLRQKELLGLYQRLTNDIRSRAMAGAEDMEARKHKPVHRGF